MDISDFPTLNATLNGLSGAFLTAGVIAIKRDRAFAKLHAGLMGTAVLVSCAFLSCYLYYHFQKQLVTRFTHEGAIRYAYFALLLSHTVLAVAVVPLVLKTLWHARRKEWDRHVRIARVTFPVWLYVSVTGVLVYFMLYVWFPGAPPSG